MENHVKGLEQVDWLYDAAVTPINWLGLGAYRRRLVGDLAGDILEIGVGTGLNLAYYGPAARVTAIEINPDLLRTTVPRAARRGYRLQAGDAQSLPFRARSFDVVVSTLVFCTVPDPLAALEEIRRVLRPGGRLLQLEHTRTGRPIPDTVLDLIAPAWRLATGGCHPNRDTAALLTDRGWHLHHHERRAGGLLRLLISTPPG